MCIERERQRLIYKIAVNLAGPVFARLTTERRLTVIKVADEDKIYLSHDLNK
jgi:hypothetical protein